MAPIKAKAVRIVPSDPFVDGPRGRPEDTGIRIGFGTRVYALLEDGSEVELPGVTAIDLSIRPGDVVRATIECIKLDLPESIVAVPQSSEAVVPIPYGTDVEG